MSPWLSIVLLGVAITGYAWMMPKSNGKEAEFASEAAYNQLLEDLETENRELVDAVAKFKREQDETVERLGRRIVDMEQQMKKWSEQTTPNLATTDSNPSIIGAPSFPTNEIYVPSAVTDSLTSSSLSVTEAPDEDAEYSDKDGMIEIPPTTIRGRYPELLEMHDKGRSVEQIAKAMGMNKGEVQLILQLVRREEDHHA
ncbi:hypothetical protein [Cohnella mopanensis]|uniref:hypothetical protein n=1 Tax=Cohnella mopanensis TaxID=2911966 RepID=UPI001EF8A7A5|nr:hypothetical protein [Cohnella mopanensis]